LFPPIEGKPGIHIIHLGGGTIAVSTDAKGQLITKAIEVKVKKSKTPKILVLSSEKPVTWSLQFEDGAAVEKVILVGEGSKLLPTEVKSPVVLVNASVNYLLNSGRIERMPIREVLERQFNGRIESFQAFRWKKPTEAISSSVDMEARDVERVFERVNSLYAEHSKKVASLNLPEEVSAAELARSATNSELRSYFSNSKSSLIAVRHPQTGDVYFIAGNKVWSINKKDLSAKPIQPPSGSPPLNYSQSLTILKKTGEIFITQASQVFVYQPQNQKWRFFDTEEKTRVRLHHLVADPSGQFLWAIDSRKPMLVRLNENLEVQNGEHKFSKLPDKFMQFLFRSIRPGPAFVVDGYLALNEQKGQGGRKEYRAIRLSDGKPMLIFDGKPYQGEDAEDMAYLANGLIQPHISPVVTNWESSVDARKQFVGAAVERGFNFSPDPIWSKIPGLCLEQCPTDFFVNTSAVSAPKEVHVVGVYEQKHRKIGLDGKPEQATLKVNVNRAKKPVILILAAYEPVMWEVIAANGVKVENVFLLGQKPSTVRAPAGTKTETLPYKNSAYTYKSESGDLGGGELLFKLAQSTTGMQALSFQGGYSADSFSIPFYKDTSIFAEIETAHKAKLNSLTIPAPAQAYLRMAAGSLGVSDGRSSWPGIPKLPLALNDIFSVTYSPSNSKFYGISHHEFFEVDTLSGLTKKIEPPNGYPRMSWLGGMAYDPRSKRVLIASGAHTGYHHSWDPIKNDWKVFEVVGHNGVRGLVFDPLTKKMYALMGNQLCTIDESFKILSKTELSLDKLGSRHGANHTQLAVVNGKIVIQIEGRSGRSQLSQRFLVDPATGLIQMIK
jgi:hypothetical protein